jgi:hypothetical protein
MNLTRTREAYRRDLTNRMSHLRLLADQQAVQHKVLTRLHGIAHPRSIVVSRRLNHTLSTWRELRRLHLSSASQDRRPLDQGR